MRPTTTPHLLISLPVLLACLLLASALPVFADPGTQPPASQPATPTSDLWFRILMGDKPVGWSRITVTNRPDNLIQTHDELHMALRRAGISMNVDEAGECVETPAGEPVSVFLNENQSGVPSTVLIDVQPDQFVITRGHGNDQVRQTIPKDPAKATPLDPPLAHWLPSQAARRYLREQIHAGVKQITFPSIDPSIAIAVRTAHYTRLGSETLDIDGRKIPTTTWTYTLQGLESIPSKYWLDDDANLVKTTIPFTPGREMLTVQCTKDQALAAVSPQETLIDTFIVPDRNVPDARKLRQASFEIHFNVADLGEGFKAPALPRVSCQRVVWDNRTTALAIIDLDDPVTPEADVPRDADRLPSLLVNFNSPKMQSVLNQSTKLFSSKDDNAAKAEKLRHFVYSFVTNKEMDVGMATAAATAESAHGDCKGHAILLTALLRANKIPARVAMGIVYSDQFQGKAGIFDFHMWTQAWLQLPDEDGNFASRWVDLDSAITPDFAFDATHIAFLTSSLSDDKASEQTSALSPYIGRISIKVITPEELPDPPKWAAPPTTQPASKHLTETGK